MQRTQVWFLEAIQQTGLDLYESIVTMLEGAVHHKEHAESRVEDAYTPVRKDDEICASGGVTISQNDDLEEVTDRQNFV